MTIGGNVNVARDQSSVVDPNSDVASHVQDRYPERVFLIREYRIILRSRQHHAPTTSTHKTERHDTTIICHSASRSVHPILFRFVASEKRPHETEKRERRERHMSQRAHSRPFPASPAAPQCPPGLSLCGGDAQRTLCCTTLRTMRCSPT